MRRYWPLVGTGLLCLVAGGVLHGQAKPGAQQTGDVFSSGGGGTPVDPRKYVSPDGRFLDRKSVV